MSVASLTIAELLANGWSPIRTELHFRGNFRITGDSPGAAKSWYCSEHRLAFGRTVVLRYRYELEAKRLAPATINLRLCEPVERLGRTWLASSGTFCSVV
jgi:hypothetical protein